MFQAESLHTICGAEVQLTITSDTNEIYSYTSHKIQRRTCGTQFGTPAMPPIRTATRSFTINNTPTKLVTQKKKPLKENLPPRPMVINLPGKNKMDTSVRAIKK